jgi:hypothetical protein
MQIIKSIDDSHRGSPNYKPFNVIEKLSQHDSALAADEETDLRSSDKWTWSWKHYKRYYSDYCALAQQFISGDYSANKKISQFRRDWHPLGFAQNLADGADPDSTPCDVQDWEKKANSIENVVGARVFLIKNFKLQDLQDQVLIDFFYPNTTLIPDFTM